MHISTGYEPRGRLSLFIKLGSIVTQKSYRIIQTLTLRLFAATVAATTPHASAALHHLVPKLTGTNYATCATKMEMVLIEDDLWPIICEEQLRPAITQSESASTGRSRTRTGTTGPANDTEAATVLKWDADARKATANILLCLDA